MAKTAGYLRGYRARRAANKGRPLGRALTASEAADVDFLMSQKGYSRSRAVAEVRGVNELIKVQMAALRGDFSKIKPTSKAPRGFAAEWQARQAIHTMLDKSIVRSSRAAYHRNRYRGTKSGRRDHDRRGELIGALRRFDREAHQIIQGGGSWVSKAKEIRWAYRDASAWVYEF